MIPDLDANAPMASDGMERSTLVYTLPQNSITTDELKALAELLAKATDVHEQLTVCLVEREIERFKTIAFAHRHDILAALGAAANPPAIIEQRAEIERLRGLVEGAIATLESVERETSWGCPTFGPTPSEELRAALNPTGEA